MYGGYGGYGGYNSYGGYGSNYMSSYGSLGNYGGYGDRNSNQSPTRSKRENCEKSRKNKEKTNKSNQNQYYRIKKLISQQFSKMYFKMMGGLRSILELGFAALALSHFVTTSSELLKKLFFFTKQKGGIMTKYLQSKLNTKFFSALTEPSKRVNIFKKLLLYAIRIFTFSLAVLGIRLRKQIKEEGKRKQEEMIEELRNIKEKQIEILSQSEIPNQGDDVTPAQTTIFL